VESTCSNAGTRLIVSIAPPRVASAALAFLLLCPLAATAAEFPQRPVRVITPYAAGGGIDVLTRTVAQRLTQLWGQQVIVDNRPGGGATVGTAVAAKAAPDGYTLVVGGNALAIGPVVYPNLPYDARRDFAPIGMIASTPEVLVVNPGLRAGNVSELIAIAKAGARKLNYGSAGSGTLAHLAAEAFNRRTGLGAAHIPYKGSNPALIDLLSGQIDWAFDSPTAVVPHVRAGKLRALAIAAAQRSPQLPEVPTLAEAGFPDLEFSIWLGLMAPSGTPEAVLRQIERDLTEALRDPAVRVSLATQGWDVAESSSARDLAAFLERELVKLGAAARAAGVKAD
jgi:tripartite-type tricarboxylate transporter receptor subunit TctC